MIENINRRYLIIAGGVLVVILGLFMLLSGNNMGTLSISAPQETPHKATVQVTITRPDMEDIVLAIQPGTTKTVELAEGPVRVDANADSLRAVDVVTIRGGQTSKITTPVGEEREIQQLASNIKSCARLIEQTVYSFDCGSIGAVQRHTANKLGTSTSTELYTDIDGATFSALESYKNGLMGFFAGEGATSQPQYLDIANEQIVEVPLTTAMRQKIANGATPTLAMPSDPMASYFAVYFAGDKKIYLFDDITDTSPTAITPPEAAEMKAKGRVIAMTFSSNSLDLYLGNGEEGEGEGTQVGTAVPDEPEKKPTYLYEYSLKGKLSKTVHLAQDTQVSSMQKLTNGFYAGVQPYGVTFFQLQGDQLKPVYNLPELASWAVYNNKAYLMADGTIYEFVPGDNGSFALHSLYSSSDITASELFAGPAGILFSGISHTTGVNDQPLNFYRLLARGEKASVNEQAGSGNIVAVEPTYTGVTDLMTYGVSTDQVTNFRFALGNFIAGRNSAVTEVKIVNVSVEPHDIQKGTDFANFDIIINNTNSYKARMEYFDFSAIHLVITNPTTGEQLFDSGVVNP